MNKIIYPGEFERIVSGYKLLPEVLVHFVSISLPWIEVVVGLTLISGIFIKISTIILSALLVIFIMAVGINVIRGNLTDCGCFSSTTPITSTWDGILVIFRDILFLIPGFLILFFNKKVEEKTEKTQAV